MAHGKRAAVAVGKSIRTLRQWRRRGVGPPYAYFADGKALRTLVEKYTAHRNQANDTRP